MTAMRRLLMVAYHFPPVGGVGVERSLRYATYLPAHGWQPVIVTPGNAAHRIMAPGSVDRIPPGTEVHRAPTLEPAHVRAIAGRILRRAARGRVPVDPRGGVGSLPPAGTATTGGGLRARANAAWAWLIPRLFFPDEQLLWIPGAIASGELAHRHSPVDAVYSSSPPVSGHLAAAVLARRLGVPWIADFRDPWMGNAFVTEMRGLHRAAQRSLERSIVSRADRVVFVTGTWRRRYAERYPDRADRFIHIPNGYDSSELGGGSRLASTPDDPYRLIYAGSIYGDRELALFLDALDLALRREPGLRERLRIQFVGLLNARNAEIARLRGPHLTPTVEFLGFRPRPEVLDMERAADAGLILIADDPGRDADINAKLYEYIGLNLPVFAVAPPGETRATLAELDWGVGVDPTPEAIADGLIAMTRLPRPDRAADPEGRYERRALTARLAALLDEVMG